jgi:hypothetical protein
MDVELADQSIPQREVIRDLYGAAGEVSGQPGGDHIRIAVSLNAEDVCGVPIDGPRPFPPRADLLWAGIDASFIAHLSVIGEARDQSVAVVVGDGTEVRIDRRRERKR